MTGFATTFVSADSHPPASDPYLAAFQNAFGPELEAAVQRYRLTARDRVLDVPCGDGYYTALFARYMTGGVLVAADRSDDLLAAARRRVAARADGPRIDFRRADVYAMPFEAGSFDFVWCAQSMISLDDPVAALREVRRVLRPAGRVAVLETDEFHHVVLPWPVELELALQRAVRDVCRRRYGDGTKFAQSRKLRAALQAAGFSSVRKTTLAADRQAAFGPAERTFLSEHFRYLRTTVGGELTPAEAEAFAHFADPVQPDSLLNRPSAELTVLASLHHARS